MAAAGALSPAAAAGKLSTSGTLGGAPTLGSEAFAPAASARKEKQKRRLKPGQRWDGRVSGLSLEEYRELKWSMESSFSKTERRGPSYSLRPRVWGARSKSSPVFQTGDPVRSMNAVKPASTSHSFGLQTIFTAPERSPGPQSYQIKSTMDPTSHPTRSKHRGCVFGSEVLAAQDEASPAPGDYDDTRAFKHSAGYKHCPNFTIQGREAWREPIAAPGPAQGEYKFENVMRYGKDTPIKWTAQGKTEPINPARGSRQYIGPGPPHYNPPGAGSRSEPRFGSMKTCNPSFKFGSDARGIA